MKSIFLGKLGGLALVFALLLAGLGQITGVVHDRQQQNANALSSVSHSLAGSQTLLGPLLQIGCTEEWGEAPTVQQREFTRVLAPASLIVTGNSQVEARARGLHATQVFTLRSRIAAQWTDLSGVEGGRLHTGSRLKCGPPSMVLAVSDARGIRQADVLVDGQRMAVRSGTGHPSYPRGIQVVLPSTTGFNSPLKAEVVLELVGTEGLNIAPVGDATQINLTSNWAHPSFSGQFLPAERTISGQGFDAAWRVSALASSAQQAVLNNSVLCAAMQVSALPQAAPLATKAGCVEILGVGFMDPVNTYSLSDRATKYGFLFIALTFVAVGLFEFMRGLRVHPIQYFLVGAAISIFFLLLMSLSEHLSFGLAYALAASACVLLLGYYASFMLKGWHRGMPFGVGIATLYGMLYLLLQLEQTAMVVGAIALFIVLSAVMTLTRKVNWYERMQVA